MKSMFFSLVLGFLLAIVAAPFFIDIHNLEDNYEDQENNEDK